MLAGIHCYIITTINSDTLIPKNCSLKSFAIVTFCLPTHNLLNIFSWAKAEEKDDICESRCGGQDHTQKPGGQGPGGGQGCTQELGGGQGRTQEPGGGQRLTQQREQEPAFRGRLVHVAGVHIFVG